MRIEFKGADGSALGTWDNGKPCAKSLAAPASPPSRMRGPGTRLVAELFALAGGHGILVAHRQHAWASVTFSGTRHELAFRYEGEAAVVAAENLIATLSDHEFAIPRQLVADAAVIEVSHKTLPQSALELKCELLLLDQD